MLNFIEFSKYSRPLYQQQLTTTTTKIFHIMIHNKIKKLQETILPTALFTINKSYEHSANVASTS